MRLALVRDEDLSLFLEATEGRRVNDAVPISGERRAGAARRLGEQAAGGARGVAGVGRPGVDGNC